MTVSLQPDQRYAFWNAHVGAYETVFEPLTDRFAAAATAALALRAGTRCLDVAAGTGGAALTMARAGAEVLAVDAAEGMAARVSARARAAGLPVTAAVMDAQRLAVAAETFDAALSIFGIVLCPDAAGALREMARAMKWGGRLALVTWTEPENYELVGRLLAATAAVRGSLPPPMAPPAQLRFKDAAALRALLAAGGLAVEEIRRIEAGLEAPSARWLADRLVFTPGMAAMLAALGERRAAVLDRFVADLERDRGHGSVRLAAVALLGVGRRDETFDSLRA